MPHILTISSNLRLSISILVNGTIKASVQLILNSRNSRNSLKSRKSV